MCTLLEQALVKCRKTIVNFFFFMLFVLIKKSRNRKIRSSELFVIVKIKAKQGYIRLLLRMKAGCIFRLYAVC